MAPRVVLTHHARRQAIRRGVAEAVVRDVAMAPDQIIAVRVGREIRQSRVIGPDGRVRLVRVCVDRVDGDIVVVTVYRTSRVAKYWRGA